jgi:hypothetical protein
VGHEPSNIVFSFSKDQQHWFSRAELYAVIMVLREFPLQLTNLYSDSHYVVGVLCYIETAYIGHISSE